MIIEKVKLTDFRNFDNIELNLTKGINVFHGDNAQGKTNFLESLYLCSVGRSFRTHLDKELIKFNKKESHLQIFVNNNNIQDKIDVHLKKDDKKTIFVNSVQTKKLGELFGVLYIIVFSPEDLQLIKAGPSERRKFMDLTLCQLSKIYYYELKNYYHVLKQRNNLLKRLDKKPELKDTVFAWDSQLVNSGIKIINYRKEFIEKINILANKFHSDVTNATENLCIDYKQNVSPSDFMHKLEKFLERDIILGSTSYGIHKDDLIYTINGYDIKIFGSQGQIRTACLSSKLSEIEIFKEEKNVYPVLLLDDVLSELDEKRQKFLLNNIAPIQTILTCTGVEDIIRKTDNKFAVYKVENGIITFESC